MNSKDLHTRSRSNIIQVEGQVAVTQQTTAGDLRQYLKKFPSNDPVMVIVPGVGAVPIKGLAETEVIAAGRVAIHSVVLLPDWESVVPAEFMTEIVPGSPPAAPTQEDENSVEPEKKDLPSEPSGIIIAP